MENSNNKDNLNNLNNIDNANNNTLPEKSYPNKFIKFAVEHCFGIAVLICCFYVISFIFVTIGYSYNTTTFTSILYTLYIAFFVIFVLFYFILAIVYKNPKYVLNILIGILIGLFTCGGFLIVL